MAAKVTVTEVEDFIRQDPDRLAGDYFAEGSFAKHAYLNASEAHLSNPRAEKADRAECTRWSLTPEDWAETLRAVARARRHDAKLDIINEGVGQV